MKQALLRFTICCFFGLIAAFSLRGQTFLMDSVAISACKGFFYDSGGTENEYGPNESFVSTICSNAADNNYIRLRFSGIDLGAGDRLCFYDGPDTLAPLLACYDALSKNQAFIIQASAANASGCLTVFFTSDADEQGSGWQADIDCIDRCQSIEALLANSTPEVAPADSGWINLCPGESLSLSGTGIYAQNGLFYQHSDQTSSFQWDFGDGSTALGPEVQHRYDKPGGYTVQLKITDQLGCSNTNFISQRIRVSGPPQFEENPMLETQFCFGDTLMLNAQINRKNDSLALSVLPSTYSFQTSTIRSDSLALPDGDGQVYERSVYISGFSPAQTLNDVNDILGICMNIEHSWLRDLEITLFCPSGDSVILHDHVGKTGSEVFLGAPIEDDDILIPGSGFDYCWKAGASNPSWLDFIDQNQVDTLPAADYQPAQMLDQLLACPLNGEWTIKVEDLWEDDNGMIFSWGIDFSSSVYPNLETFSPQVVSSSWLPDTSMFERTDTSFKAVPGRPGANSFTLEVTDEFGCSFDTSLQIDVLPPNQLFCLLRDTLEKGPLLKDTIICQGGGLQLDVSLEYEDTSVLTFETLPDYAIGNSNHPHNIPYRSNLLVDNVFPDSLIDPTAQIVSVCVELETDWVDDIHLFLQAPNDSILELSTNNGGSGDNYSTTCFSPSATDSIVNGQAPFAGDFQPEGAWNLLNGTPINGDWTLLVSDGAGQNEVGKLVSWSITFNTENEIRYQWLPEENISCTDCDMPVFSPPNTTDYILILSDNYQQEYRDTFTIEVSDQPCNLQQCTLSGQVLEQLPPTCANSRDGQLRLTATDGAGPFEFRINGSLITGDTVTFTSLNAGEQVIVITDQSACIDTLRVELLQADSFRLNLFVEQELSCADSTDAILVGNVQGGQGPYQFDWRGQNSTTNRLEGIGPGIYSLLVEDNNGCLLEDSIQLVSPLPIVLDFDIQAPRCPNTADGSLTVLPIGGEGPYQILWNTGATTEQISNLNSGLYEVSVTDSRGCQRIASTQLEAPVELKVDSFTVTPVNCFGGNSGSARVWVSGGSQPYNYRWGDSNGQTDSVAVGLTAGSYQLSITDQNGCEIQAEVAIPEPSPIVVDLKTTEIQCQGKTDGSITAMASGGTAPYTFNWSNNQMGPEINNLPSGVYRLTLTDAEGCQVQESTTITEPDVGLDLRLEQVTQGCFGEKGNSARVRVTGGSGPFNYLWSDGQTTEVAQGLDSLAYGVQVTDINGCFTMDSIKIQDLAPLVPNIIISPPSCQGTSNGALGINFVEGGSNADLEDYTFVWSNGATGSFNDGLIGGETYEVTVTDPIGCQAVASRTMSQAVQISYEANITPVQCFGERNGKIELNNIEGRGNDFRIRWDIVSGGEDRLAQNLAAGSYSFTITDAANCTLADTLEVTQAAPILIEFETNDIDCFSNSGGNISAQVRGGTTPYQYLWSTQDTSTFIDNLLAGNYTLTVTDANNCQLEKSASVNQPEVFETIISTKMPSCEGDRNGAISIEVEGGSPPYEYSLDNNDFQISNAFLGLLADSYTIYIRDKNGCTLFERVELEDPAPLSILASPQNARIRIGESLQLQADHTNGIGEVQYFWKAPYEGTLSCNQCPDPISTPQYTITYELIGTDENGCTGNDFLMVNVEKPKEILVPTGFTPNDDGLNDVLIVHGDAETLIRSFQVFDRWGSLIFESANFPANDQTGAWNGRYNNQEAGNGVYLWIVEAEFTDGSTEVFKGQTSLIR